MVTIECAKCGQSVQLALYRTTHHAQSPDLEFRGVVTCSKDGHAWPMAIKTDNVVQSTEQMMPVLDSANLNQKVPAGLKQDIQEAEHAHFAQLYKASVVMCRRAIQLGLCEAPHNIPDGPFSNMLQVAEAKTPPPLTPIGFIHAEAVKKYGDVGAHKTEELSAPDARAAIFSAVKVLNELFKP